ncbi:esterase/lipase family protein [Nocardia stercoris]|uniref:Lipase n=1 Tax=Nocardia stercoris TaxID=2483361 RepID=A0A3M2LE29_9NOCA|nr:lipase [Nocardia stercoris]RMI35020.1 lipase [Nocardia stercoris]
MGRNYRRRVLTAAAIATAAICAIVPGTAGAATVQDLVNAINAGQTTVTKALADTGISSPTHSTIPTGQGPVMSSALVAVTYSMANAETAPQGANDWTCKPSAAHPEPVVLLHGSWMNAFDAFSYLSPQIKSAGFCVYALNYGEEGLIQGGGLGALIPGRNGVGPMEDSAKQLSAFVDKVLASTGAKKVNIVGHSQAGPVSDQYMKFEGGASKVDQLITFGATTHGTTLDGIATLGQRMSGYGIDALGISSVFVGQGLIEQVTGSPFYAKLNANGDTVPGVTYTTVATSNDEVSTPPSATFRTAVPGATVHNITLQDGCGIDWSDHLTMLYSPRAASIALHALDPAGHPNLVCQFNPWLL